MKIKFIIWAVALHALIIVGAFFAFKEKPVVLIAFEVLSIASFCYFLYFQNKSAAALKSISSGIALIKEKDFNTRLAKTGNKEIDQLVHFYNQMMHEIRNEKIKLEEQNCFLDLLINASPLGIIILNLDSKIDRINKAGKEILGTNEYSGKQLFDIDHPIINELQKINFDQTKLINLNGNLRIKIQKRYFYDRGFQHPFFIIEELTKEFLEAEKTAYSKVIRMMSHEVNNSVGAINSILDSFLSIVDNSNELNKEEYSNVLNAALTRNEGLKTFMQNFAKVVKVPDPNKQTIDLTELLDSIILLFNQQSKELNIEFTKKIPETPVLIDADKEQMEQVLINIIKNSVEAIKENGKIKIELSSNPLELVIKDNGTGISNEIEQKLSTPFYSSKPKGQGVGLTIIREILAKHNFKYSLKSSSQWTSFKIQF